MSKDAVSVGPDAKSKTYGEADPASTGTLTGFLAADGVTTTYSRVAGETVGTYTISAVLSPAGVLGNYDTTYYSSGDPRDLRTAPTPRAAELKTYGEADPASTGTLTG